MCSDLELTLRGDFDPFTKARELRSRLQTTHKGHPCAFWTSTFSIPLKQHNLILITSSQPKNFMQIKDYVTLGFHFYSI